MACTRSTKAALALRMRRSGVGDDKGFRHGADDTQKVGVFGGDARHRLAEARQQRPVSARRLLDETSNPRAAPAYDRARARRGHYRRAAPRERRRRMIAPPDGCGVRTARRRPGLQLSWIQSEQTRRRRIGFEHPLAGRIHDQHRFGRELKQQAIAFFRIADACVFALHRLLRLGEAQL